MSDLLSKAGGPIRITKITTHDVRFPTSRSLDGSDAMNKAPDYSAAYVIGLDDHIGRRIIRRFASMAPMP